MRQRVCGTHHGSSARAAGRDLAEFPAARSAARICAWIDETRFEGRGRPGQYAYAGRGSGQMDGAAGGGGELSAVQGASSL